MASGELQAGHRAIRRTDESLHARNAEVIEQCHESVGLIGAVEGDIERAIAAEPVNRQHAKARRINGQARPDLFLPRRIWCAPSRRRVLALQATDPAQLAQLTESLTWNLRIFEERRKSLRFVCEVPVAIEQRLFALSREIQKALPEQ